ncbi:single-stranded DNA-binding protein [Spirosoma endbachense]|uniref:Single-stranded DNA-binding protein n=1 Tax=Spirosoma endbachense TaxID=2666025 RepID=A0A6P1VXP7_9BACT|nr:single-stranded DNA-binding protein [Spirosoma endbachense]QHV97971.1 single-stranded DNA-binding protein [Spirosoma endbachense]
MQQIQLIGRLGQDAKMIDHSGKKFLSFSVAVDDDYKDQAGTKIDRTVWYDCNMDNTAVAQYLKKGTQVFIQGKPRAEVYFSDRDSKYYPKFRVAVNRLQLLGAATDRPAGNDLPPVATPAGQPATTGVSGDDSNDLPF